MTGNLTQISLNHREVHQLQDLKILDSDLTWLYTRSNMVTKALFDSPHFLTPFFHPQIIIPSLTRVFWPFQHSLRSPRASHGHIKTNHVDGTKWYSDWFRSVSCVYVNTRDRTSFMETAWAKTWKGIVFQKEIIYTNNREVGCWCQKYNKCLLHWPVYQ